MLRRFASATVVGGVLIALGAVATLFMTLPPEGARALMRAWLFVPFAWGAWAVLAPASWVPERLPLWGGVLGAVLGVLIGPVFNMPGRIGAPEVARWIALVAAPVAYFFLWMAVRAVYRELERTG